MVFLAGLYLGARPLLRRATQAFTRPRPRPLERANVPEVVRWLVSARAPHVGFAADGVYPDRSYPRHIYKVFWGADNIVESLRLHSIRRVRWADDRGIFAVDGKRSESDAAHS